MMQAVCQVVPANGAFATGVIGFIDCQAQTIGAAGYAALSAQGSAVSLALTGMLTLFIALIGYRMLLGQMPTVRDGVLAFVKVGIVLALATGWSAYRTLVYDVALREPANIALAIGGASGLPGADGGLIARLDNVDQAFEELAIEGVYSRTLYINTAGQGGQNGQQAGQQPQSASLPQIAPPLFAGFDTFAIGAARAIFLAGAIGAFALARLGAGLLLALGPLFVAFLLFDGTRGLFEGWVRGLIGTALASLATAIALGVELALIEPWLSELLAERAADLSIPGVPAQLIAITTVFALVLAALILLVMRVALGFRIPTSWPMAASVTAGARQGGGAVVSVAGDRTSLSLADRSRAAIIVDAVEASQRREAAASQRMAVSTGLAGRAAGPTTQARDNRVTAATPLGQSARRRTGTRVSASAGRRDRGA